MTDQQEQVVVEEPTAEDLFNAYAKLRIAREKIEAQLKARTDSHNKAIRVARLEFKDELDKAKCVEVLAKGRIELRLLADNVTGRFLVGDDEWAQRNAPKTNVTVINLKAFLSNPLAGSLISSVSLKQAAAKALYDDLPSCKMITTESFKYRIKEDQHNE